MTDPDRLLIELTIAAPIDDVWKAVRDPAEVRRWFGWDYDGLDAEIRQIFVEEATPSEESKEHRAISWGSGDRFTIVARGDQTVVRVTRAAPADGSDWSGIYDEIDEGWISFLQQLRLALERHRGQDRRTIIGGGHAVEPGPTLSERLGLAGAGGIGQRYETTSAGGETLKGEVWFRSKNLTGLTVDGYGDGLIVVSDHAASLKPPHGGGMMVLTTYGLDDASFERLNARWTKWFEGRYKETPPSS